MPSHRVCQDKQLGLHFAATGISPNSPDVRSQRHQEGIRRTQSVPTAPSSTIIFVLRSQSPSSHAGLPLSLLCSHIFLYYHFVQVETELDMSHLLPQVPQGDRRRSCGTWRAGLPPADLTCPPVPLIDPQCPSPQGQEPGPFTRLSYVEMNSAQS